MLIFLLLILLINLLNQFRQFHFLFLFFLFLFYFYLFIYIYRKFYVSLWDYTGLFECLFIFMHKWPYCFARMLKKKDIDQKQWTRSKSTYEARIVQWCTNQILIERFGMVFNSLSALYAPPLSLPPQPSSILHLTWSKNRKYGFLSDHQLC